jgi:hypothetical protein
LSSGIGNLTDASGISSMQRFFHLTKIVERRVESLRLHRHPNHDLLDGGSALSVCSTRGEYGAHNERHRSK